MIEKVRICGYRRFREATICPHPRFNILVGENEAGKSTLLEAMEMALTGRINGRPASDQLNPYWFNQAIVAEFFEQRRTGAQVAPPQIVIEVFLSDHDEFLRNLYGAHNSEIPTRACAGVCLRITPNPEYSDEIEAHLTSESSILPVEYYKVDWRTFGDVVLTARPKELTTAIIDSKTIRASNGIDFHLRQILSDHLAPEDKAAVSLAFRAVKERMTADHLKSVNEKIAELEGALDGKLLSLAMDQSTRGSWDASVVPHVADVPFAMAGQGQQASVKIALAMGHKAQAARVVMVEEPENHLSHTSLNKLLYRIDKLAGEDQQVFVTTHSSFVLNRLGLDSLLIISGGQVHSISEVTDETVAYFKKLPGYDTLRMALADVFVAVEGPSDELVFERFYRDHREGKRPIEDGVDVISMRGLSLKRCLEFAKLFDKRCAVIRDNDGADPEQIRQSLADYLDDAKRQVFMGDSSGATLEPHILAANPDVSTMRKILGITEKADLLTWMTNNKTEAALRIAETTESVTAPGYFLEAIEFIHSGNE